MGLSDAETKLLAQRFDKKEAEKDKTALVAANSGSLGAASFLAPGYLFFFFVLFSFLFFFSFLLCFLSSFSQLTHSLPKKQTFFFKI